MPNPKQLQKTVLFIVKNVATTFILAAMIVVYSAEIEPNWLQVKEQQVYIKNLPASFEGFRIVQISDLHGKMYPDKELIKRLNQLKPDLLVITGDIFDENEEVPLSYAGQILGGLTARHGIYYVYGNNDEYLRKEDIKETLKKINIHVLDNEKTEIQMNGQKIELIGVDYTHSSSEVDLTSIVDDTGNAPKILLAHRPEIIKYALNAGIDLVLVGHTHGNQVNVAYMPKFINVLKKGYEKYSSGLFELGTTQMYVNRGLGTSDIPVRFLSRPEITVLNLHIK